MRFIDRQSELATLDRFYAYHRAAMMFVSGRLRTGKTTLLSQWLRRRDIADALFWAVPPLDAASQLRDFSQALARFDPRVQALPSGDFSFPDWRAALERMGEIVTLSRKPVLVIIDEFTHLMMTSRGVDSAFQIVWDHILSELPNTRLILTGSHVGIMERDVLSGALPITFACARFPLER
jgi:AAA+ ATPase superfamily predicted ATPase